MPKAVAQVSIGPHLEALQLEALQTVVTLSLLTDDIEDGVDELGTLGVVTLGPVVTGTLR